MKTKSVTLAEIAKKLGISSNAVSLALRGKEGVSDSLRERIITTAREMNYPGVTQPQKCILALIPYRFSGAEFASYHSSFYYNVCFQMEAYAASVGCQLIISSVSPADEAAARIPPLLSAVPFVGIITVGNLSRDYCRMIYAQGLPYVMADQYYDDVPADSVVTANASGGYLLTKHLIENGHTRIQFFGMVHRTSSLEDRWIGYSRAMQNYGLKPLDNLLLHAPGGDADDSELIPQALDALDEMPTAFVCGHDNTACTLVNALKVRGQNCPDDFSVVGFDDIQVPDIQALNLTTYSTPKKAIAETAVQLLLDKSCAQPRRIQLYGDVVYRRSVKDIRTP